MLRIADRGGVDDDRPDRGDEITKIADGWPTRKAASESGSQASGGIVRSTWNTGSSPRIAHSDWPTSVPSITPATTRGEAERDALEAGEDCARQALSVPPLSKNGSEMIGQASESTARAGAGRRSGASRRPPRRAGRLPAPRAAGSPGRRAPEIPARDAGQAAGLHGTRRSRAAVPRVAEVRPSGDPLDAEAGEVGGGVGRVEDLAVETAFSVPREVEVGMEATPSALAASRQRSSRFTLSISAFVSVDGSNLPQRMSSVRNQRSCDL